MNKIKLMLLMAAVFILLIGCSSNDKSETDLNENIETEDVQEDSSSEEDKELTEEEDAKPEEKQEENEDDSQAEENLEKDDPVTKQSEEKKKDKVEETTKEKELTIKEKDNEKSPNKELEAKSVYLQFFDGMNEENIDKISSVLKNDEMMRNFGLMFEEFDLYNEIVGEKLVSQNGSEYVYELTVETFDVNETGAYQDTESIYKITVDGDKKEITYFEISETKDL